MKQLNLYYLGGGGPSPSVPDGKTVTPINDVALWLECAGITDTGYTTVAEVLADSGVLSLALANDNANDYLARSTTFAAEIVANSSAMTQIGQNNYGANALINNGTWCTAICNSTYIESVLNVKSPDMTGATTPSGEVTASSYISSYYPWKTFDGQINTAWTTGYGGKYSTGSWIKYKFPEEVTIYALKYYHRNSDGTTAYPVRIEGSNDDSNFNLVKTFTETIDNAYHTVVFDTPSSYEWYRWYNTGETVSNLDEVKYYGRKDV